MPSDLRALRELVVEWREEVGKADAAYNSSDNPVAQEQAWIMSLVSSRHADQLTAALDKLEANMTHCAGAFLPPGEFAKAGTLDKLEEETAMATDTPRWLAGLTPLGEGVWRDDETGLEVRWEKYPEHDEARGRLLYLTVGHEERKRLLTVYGYRDGGMMFEATGNTIGPPDEADRFASALRLAAKLARAFNESGGE